MELWSLSCLESSGNENFVKERFTEKIIEPIPEKIIEPILTYNNVKLLPIKRQIRTLIYMKHYMQFDNKSTKTYTNICRNIYCHPNLIRDGVSTVTSP
jgi:hypothetical protein